MAACVCGAMQGCAVWVDGTPFSAQSVAIIVVLLDLAAAGCIGRESGLALEVARGQPAGSRWWSEWS